MDIWIASNGSSHGAWNHHPSRIAPFIQTYHPSRFHDTRDTSFPPLLPSIFATSKQKDPLDGRLAESDVQTSPKPPAYPRVNPLAWLISAPFIPLRTDLTLSRYDVEGGRLCLSVTMHHASAWALRWFPKNGDTGHSTVSDSINAQCIHFS